MTEPRPAVSLSRVLKIVVPVALIGIGAYIWSKTLEPQARKELASNSFARILSSKADSKPAAMKFPDKDGDLIADSPDDPAKLLKPDVLVFSYIAGETDSVPEESWKDLFAALKAKTGKDIKFVHFDTFEEQVEAFNKGELHIAGLNTGVVPTAVQQAGFVPLCTYGHDDGSYGITMQVLVPADSPIKKLADVKGHKIMFTRPDSNSGCKALLTLLNDQGMQPDRDYSWGFSSGHDQSINGVASKDTKSRFEAAPVSSDILQRMIKNGDVDEKAIRTVFTSDKFPPATIGIVYNLSPEIRTAIQETFKDYNLKGTSLEGKLDPEAAKLVPVDYKKDFESTRQIDQLAAKAASKRAG